MRVLYERCAGLDVHKKTVVACVLTPQYHRLAARRGAKRAIVALAHTILVVIYHVLRDGQDYQELGDAYFDERTREQTLRRSVRRLERLGYKVTVEAA